MLALVCLFIYMDNKVVPPLGVPHSEFKQSRLHKNYTKDSQTTFLICLYFKDTISVEIRKTLERRL